MGYWATTGLKAEYLATTGLLMAGLMGYYWKTGLLPEYWAITGLLVGCLATKRLLMGYYWAITKILGLNIFINLPIWASFVVYYWATKLLLGYWATSGILGYYRATNGLLLGY